MNLSLKTALFVCVLCATTAAAYAQSVQNIGADPLTGESYACLVFNPNSPNKISVTNTRGKTKTLKIGDAKVKVADHLADAKAKLKEVTKTRNAKQALLTKILNTFTAPLQVVKINTLTIEVNKLNLRVAQLTVDVALLAQLKKLIIECKLAVPVNGKFQLFTGIFPPGHLSEGRFYAIIIYIFSPNVASHYCATIENRLQPTPTRSLFQVSQNICAKIGLPECFDIFLPEAGLSLYFKTGANRPGTCTAPNICDLSTAITDANDYLSTLKLYSIKAADSSTDCDAL